VKLGFALVPGILPHVKAGRAKAYLVTGRQRFPGAPDLPTAAAEAGLRGFELEFWIGVLSPARTPHVLIARLNHDIGEVLQARDMRATLLSLGATAAPGTPEQFGAFIESESARMKALVELTGMRAE
jgi:tripartite-type tricarboxylate transporter receptor subunit TctC